MKANVRPTERVVRAVAGILALGVGLSFGGWAWWGIALDALGALLLLSASTGFCHVRKVLGDLVHPSLHCDRHDDCLPSAEPPDKAT